NSLSAMFVNIARTDVRKPAFMIAIGMPSAHGDEDEDNLRREDGDDERSQNGDGDIVEQGIMGILQCLHERGPGAVRQVKLYAQALEAMADAHMSRDDHALEEAASDAYRALHKLVRG